MTFFSITSIQDFIFSVVRSLTCVNYFNSSIASYVASNYVASKPLLTGWVLRRYYRFGRIESNQARPDLAKSNRVM